MDIEIKEIIAKNLPAHVGDTLQLRLKEANELEKQVKDLETRNSTQKEYIQKLESQLDDLRWRVKRTEELDKMKLELEDKERNLELEKIRYQLESEKDKTTFTKSVALGLVRNTDYRKTVYDHVTEPGGVDQYGNNFMVNKTQNLTEVKTEE